MFLEQLSHLLSHVVFELADFGGIGNILLVLAYVYLFVWVGDA